MSESEKFRNIVSVKPDNVEAEEWIQKLRLAEAEALAELHKKMFKQMVDEAGAAITSTLEMQDPVTDEQVDIVEDEGTYRIQFRDGSALVIGSEVWGFHITLGIHSSRLPEEDPFQGFRYVDKENGLDGQQFPRETIN